MRSSLRRWGGDPNLYNIRIASPKSWPIVLGIGDRAFTRISGSEGKRIEHHRRLNVWRDRGLNLMADPFIPVLSGLKTLLDYFAKERTHKNENKDRALHSLLAALTETDLYLQTLLPNLAPNRAKEAELARLWVAAAVPVRHFDMDLAETCLMKAEYWISPQQWLADDVKEDRVKIKNVRRQIEALL